MLRTIKNAATASIMGQPLRKNLENTISIGPRGASSGCAVKSYLTPAPHSAVTGDSGQQFSSPGARPLALLLALGSSNADGQKLMWQTFRLLTNIEALVRKPQ